jgi:uncharacterized protein YqiB (DUF1249 family)
MKNAAYYKPNLDEFLSQCEVNYLLILKLLPFLNVKSNQSEDLESDGLFCFEASGGQQIEIKLIEKAKYTTTFFVKLHPLREPAQKAITLMARLYHDAKLLEVMDKVGPKALKPKNTGSQLNVEQTDEKRQLNRFLGESLKFCLTKCRQTVN